MLKKWFSFTDSKPLKMTNVSQYMVSKMVSLSVFYPDLMIISIDNTISLVMRLLGGKKKRKKKIYTKPKKIKHKHRKRPKALLEYFNVDNTGKISKLKIECEKCPAGKFNCSSQIKYYKSSMTSVY